MHRILYSVTLIACCASLCAHAGQLEMLINQLSGADEVARSEARQFLRQQNPLDAVPKVLPLLTNENPAVWCAAFNVLADFANAVAAPGHDAEQSAVAAFLMALVAPDQPEQMKIRGLKLLPIVVPEGFDVGPMAALLRNEDANLREKACSALEETGTTQAAEALCAALSSADPALQADMLQALARISKPICEGSVLPLAQSEEPKVRAAAALALSSTGNPAYTEALVKVWKNSDLDTTFDACDALLRLADVMARQGGKYELSMAIYRQVLREETNMVHLSGGIAGLGRFGDETAAPDILAALQGPNGRELECAALAAFEGLQGVGAAKALLEAYPNMSKEIQLGMLGVFGRKQDAQFLPLLNDAVRSGDSAFRQAALAALSDSQLPGALDGLKTLAASASAEEKPAIVESIQRMAQIFRNRGDREIAGKAFLALYQLADAPELKQEGLDGVKQFPVAEAFDVIMSAMSAEEVGNLSPGIMFGLAKAMSDAGRAEDAQKLTDTVMTRMNTTDAVRDVINVLSQGGQAAPDMGQRLGFVLAWRVAGPFPWSMNDAFNVIHINEPNVDVNASYTVEEKAITWQPLSTAAVNGAMDLMGGIGTLENVCAYALAKITVPEACDAVVRTGSDDGIKVWVNGEVAVENNIDRGMDIDQDQGAAKLNAGENTILVEVTQNGGGWNFCLRLTRPDGTVLPFTMAQ